MKSNKPAIIGKYTGKSCEANIHNNNDMRLSVELFQKIISSDEYKRAIKNGHYLGYLGHPDDPDCQHYQDACIVMRNMKLVGTDVEAEFDLLDTPVGRIVKTCEDAGIHFGISIRGAGDVDEQTGDVNPDTFIFRGFDLVGFPAYNDCIPKFTEIAASTDIKAQSNYKKICSAIKDNVQYITSSTTLETLQDQFKEGLPEYDMITERIDELNADPVDQQTKIAVMQQQLDGVMDLYLEEKAEKEQLAQDLVNSQAENLEIAANCNRKIAALKRITANQVRDLRKAKDKVVASNNRLADKVKILSSKNTEIQSQNTKLQGQLDSAKKNNLKYNQKVVANSRIISDRDSTIEDLESRLNETVAESTQLKSKVSNLGTENSELKERITAAEQMVLEYQKAYANIYANALGVHLENISVTASTSVEQLQNIITASTSTANIPAMPDINDEIEDDELVDLTSEDELVIM